MKQYKRFMIVMFFLSVVFFGKVNAVVKDYSLLGRVIYLDAGHGGKDSGAVSNYIIEKDVNLILVEKLEKVLVSKGAMVFLTRDGDYDLSSSTVNRKRSDLYKRAMLINESGCDMYISIHLNATTSSKWNGIQIFYDDIVKENKYIAEILTNTLSKNMGNIREYKEANDYYMYSKIKVPGVLIEAGFISNANDNYKLRQEDYQNILVNNIASGIEEYFNNKKDIKLS